ncbi:FAD-dependent monooxygenase [Streptomyces sp. Amel2xB2]|uniref:FAD-dependent monooxygenase n=1 Tax=Streptomyces sp. Amel2xB2 TaxID=1305829 RepID=UPI0021ACD86E|nr:FAD-dependent monooxygenase [Streptomyces sp. Amel2xB2]
MGAEHHVEVPVLVVGGGGCGLAASVFLADLGVEHLLVERRESTSVLPRAHYLNQRTMEIFRQHGMAADVYRLSTPLENMSEVAWRTSLAGDGPLDARDVHRMDSFGGGSTAGPYAADSPCPSTNLPQHRLEPLLREHAERRSPGRVRFHHVMEDFHQDADGVTARVTDRSTGWTGTVRARYLLGADGGRGVADALGIAMDGDGGSWNVVSVHFSADLSRWWSGDKVLITNFVSPDGGPVSRYGMVAMGPRWGPASQEWALHFHLPPDAGVDVSEEAAADRVRELLKLPELDVTVHQVSRYRPEAVVAQAFRSGRVFLAGDAAHRQPPATGLGLNTAVQDAHNLAWKLAAVLSGRADGTLLDSYESERLPVAHRTVDWAMFSFRNHGVLHASLGLLPGQPDEVTRAAFAALFADSPISETRRARTAEVFATQRMEYQAHDIEVGFFYERGALVADGTGPPPRDPMGSVHHPVARPGHRLPHAWLAGGEDRLSTLDLAGGGGAFALITGAAADGWRRAAKRIADECDVELRVVSVSDGPGPDDCPDAEGRWAAVRGVGEDGAVLVRPDNHVAWRTAHGGADAEAALGSALRRVLGRSDDTTTTTGR